MKKVEIEDFVEMMLEDESFEDLLARFDLDPGEVFVALFENGLIDEETLIEMRGY